MIDIFLYKSSSLIIKEFLNSRKGSEKRGAHQALAQALRIFPSYLSLILKGDRTLNLEQGILLADYIKLNKEERRYLLRVIEYDRAQGERLKKELESEILEIASKEHQISSKVNRNNLALSMDEAARFFSSWKYSAIHLMAATTPNLNAAIVAKKLKLEIIEVKDIFDFLLSTGLWIKKEKEITIGTAFIHLDHRSALLHHHHMNWRLKSIDQHQAMIKEEELAYSLCVALSKEDALKIRSKLLSSIEEIRKVTDPSESEVIYNLNLDWLKVLGKE